MPNMIESKSSLIAAHGYDQEKKELHIKFTDGAVWKYHGVEPQHYSAFTAAESHGKHFHKNIRNAFKGEKVS